MVYLVRTGGDFLYTINECSAETEHYESREIDPISINVNPRRPLLTNLRRLIAEARDSSEHYSTSRINLLYEKESDILDVELSDVFDQPTFDFWVEGNDEEKRFRYVDKQIFIGNRRLDRHRKIREIFGYAPQLELTYAGSPGVELSRRNDHEVFERYQSRRATKILEDIGLSVDMDPTSLLEAYVLRFLVSSERSVELDDVVNAVTEDGYWCGCFLVNEEEDVQDTLNKLISGDMVNLVNGRYVLRSKYRKERSGRDLAGVKLEDPSYNDILLALRDSPGDLRDILRELEDRGMDPDAHHIRHGLDELLSDDVIIEVGAGFGINPKYIQVNPNQLGLPL